MNRTEAVALAFMAGISLTAAAIFSLAGSPVFNTTVSAILCMIISALLLGTIASTGHLRNVWDCTVAGAVFMLGIVWEGSHEFLVTLAVARVLSGAMLLLMFLPGFAAGIASLYLIFGTLVRECWPVRHVLWVPLTWLLRQYAYSCSWVTYDRMHSYTMVLCVVGAANVVYYFTQGVAETLATVLVPAASFLIARAIFFSPKHDNRNTT